jgi:eukaryotic-like serine/threonine-protein kinase
MEIQSINESLREQFESAWVRGKPISIDKCLPQRDDSQYLPTLEELIHIDMEFCWSNKGSAAGVPARKVESYIQEFRELDSEEIVLRLIDQEIRCRKRINDLPTVNEYRSRFPTLCDQIDEVESVQTLTPESAGHCNAVDKPGEQLGRYFIQDHQGAGGFGLVWQADDPKLGRRIAIKQLSGPMAANAEQRTRFISEARIAARLEHPGIVPVYDLESESDSQSPYYTMKLVSGQTLEEVIRGFRADAVKSKSATVARLKLLNIFLAVCRAMEYAHDHGIVHRDLKPQNIIVGDYGETIILDWGLAKQIGTIDKGTASAMGDAPLPDHHNLTRAGSLMGTPAYMSPEQATGEMIDIDQRSDIYSLGVILFKILTSELPFAANSSDEMIQKVIDGAPRQPRSLDRSIAAPLQSICLKAMNRNLHQRYQAVANLSADIEKFLADESVDAHPESIPERIGRWTRKNRHWVMTAAIIGVLITLGSIISAVLIDQQRNVAIANEKAADEARIKEAIAKTAALKAATEEKQARIDEQEQRQRAQNQLARSYIKEAQQQTDKLDVYAALLWLTKALEAVSDDPRENEVHRLRLNALFRRVPYLQNLFFDETDDQTIDIQWSADDKQIFVVGRKALKIRNAETDEITSTIPFDFAIRNAVFDEEQKTLLVGNESATNPQVSLVDISTGKTLWTQSLQDEKGEPKIASVVAVAMSSDQTRIVVAADDGRLQAGINFWMLLDGKTGEKLSEQIKQGSRVSDIGFSPDSKTIVNGCWDNSVSLWKADDGELIKRLDLTEYKDPDARLTPVCLLAKFSPDGKRILATSGHQGFVWDAELLDLKYRIAHRYSVRHPEIKLAAFSESGNRFATVDAIYRTRVWESETGNMVSEFKDHRGSINHIEFFKEKLLLTASRDATAKLWDAETTELVNSVFRHGDSIIKCRVDDSGYKAVSASLDQTVRVWNVARSQGGSATKPIKPGQILVQRFAQKGKYFATYSTSGKKYSVDIWDAETLQRIGNSIEFEESIVDLQFGENGERLLVNCSANLLNRKIHFVQLFDATTAQPITEKLEHSRFISSAGFLRDGKRLFTSSHDKSFVCWDIESSKSLHRQEHDAGINVASLSPDGTFLVTGCMDKTAHMWSTDTFQRLGEAVELAYPVTSISIFPESDDILISGYSLSGRQNVPTGEARIFRKSTGNLLDFRFANNSYLAPKLREDGRYIMTFGNGKQVAIFDSLSGDQLCLIEHRDSVLSANFHPHLPRFVSAGSDKLVRVWDIETGQPASAIMQHIGIPAEAKFSPSGHVVLTTLAFGNVVRTFDSVTAEPVTLDMNYSMFPDASEFTENGDWIFVGGNQPLFWNFEKYGETIESTLRTTELLACHRVDQFGAMVPLSVGEIRSRWEELQATRSGQEQKVPDDLQ